MPKDSWKPAEKVADTSRKATQNEKRAYTPEKSEDVVAAKNAGLAGQETS